MTSIFSSNYHLHRAVSLQSQHAQSEKGNGIGLDEKMEGGRTGSSDARVTAYSSLLVGTGGIARARPFRGREIALTNVGGGALVVLRAITFGTVTGVTSDARPTRK